MPYTKTNWIAGVTPLSQGNMLNLETQYDEADAELTTHEGVRGLHNTIVRKTADETVNNSAVLQNDDELVLAVAANDIYHIVMWLRTTLAATSDFKYAFTTPAGGSIYDDHNYPNPTGKSTAVAARDATVANPFIALVGDNLFVVNLLYIGGGSAGNVQLQWAQQTAAAEDTKVLTNSYLIAHKLN